MGAQAATGDSRLPSPNCQPSVPTLPLVSGHWAVPRAAGGLGLSSSTAVSCDEGPQQPLVTVALSGPHILTPPSSELHAGLFHFLPGLG